MQLIGAKIPLHIPSDFKNLARPFFSPSRMRRKTGWFTRLGRTKFRILSFRFSFKIAPTVDRTKSPCMRIHAGKTLGGQRPPSYNFGGAVAPLLRRPCRYIPFWALMTLTVRCGPCNRPSVTVYCNVRITFLHQNSPYPHMIPSESLRQSSRSMSGRSQLYSKTLTVSFTCAVRIYMDAFNSTKV